MHHFLSVRLSEKIRLEKSHILKSIKSHYMYVLFKKMQVGSHQRQVASFSSHTIFTFFPDNNLFNH